MFLPRRSFLIGAASLFAAPAIVRAESLMKIKPIPVEVKISLFLFGTHPRVCVDSISRDVFSDIQKDYGEDFWDQMRRVGRMINSDETAVITFEKTKWMNNKEEIKEKIWAIKEIAAPGHKHLIYSSDPRKKAEWIA